MLTKLKKILAVFVILFFPYNILALTYSLPAANHKIVGSLQNIQLQENDDYPTIGQRYDLGYYELYEANPGADPDTPIAGTILLLPTQYILPAELHDNIVVNIAELRLYYASSKLQKVFVFPIGIGRDGDAWITPVGTYNIIQKIKDPIWTAPASILKYRAEHHDPVPKVVPAGPDNPLGKFAMRLSQPNYLIHGTDDPVGIGRRSSGGCIRLYPQDIEKLFAMTEIKTQVIIINTPYKATIDNNKIYFEAHMPLYEQRILMHGDLSAALNAVKSLGPQYDQYVNWQKVKQIANEHLGVPEVVGEIPGWKETPKETPSAEIPYDIPTTINPNLAGQLATNFLPQICKKYRVY